MVTKQKHFLDSLRQMVSKSPEDICPNCKKAHEGDFCPEPESAGGNQSYNTDAQNMETAFLVDLVSNHKIKIPVPKCDIGRDETNDIVVSGDQSISRHHLHIVNEDGQYYLEDNNSRHGTFLNGTQIKTRELINDGDVVKIGVSLFWFVIEAGATGQNGSESRTNLPALPKASGGESVHLSVRSEYQSKSSDSGSSTMNEIPVMPNEQSLLENLRLKTRSFDQAGLFTSAQSQAATISPQISSTSNKTLDDTQSAIPAMSLDPLLSSQHDSGSFSSFKNSEPIHNSTPITAAPAAQTSPAPTFVESTPAQDLKSAPSELISGSTVYDQLMGNDLAEMINRYNHLKEEIDRAQQERQAIAEQLNTIRSLGTNLIGGTNGQLIEACCKVFSKLGWQISLNSNDSQELQLQLDHQAAIARIIWTNDEPARSHLGQLSIAQTHLWCDRGEEPKGILVVSRAGVQGQEIPTLTKADYESELAKYAAKKNVCMMTSAQVLAIYRDLVLKHSDAKTLREKISNTSGWLEGFTLKLKY